MDTHRPGGRVLTGDAMDGYRTGNRGAAGAAAVLALVVGAGLVVDRGAETTETRPVPAAAILGLPTPVRVASEDADALLAEALVGEWTTGVVTRDEATAAMARTGTLGYRESVLAVLRLPGTFRITFEHRRYRAQVNGGPRDEGTWHVRDGRLVLVPGCDHCGLVLAPHLYGGVLRLALLEDTSPDVERVPDAAYATVPWTSAPFRRR